MKMQTYAQNRFGEKLETVLSFPELGGKFPSVVLVSGIGATLHETKNSHDEIAERLCDAGFLTVQFSFAGRGNSEGNYEVMTLSRQARQLEDMTAWVQQLPEALPDRIGIYAMSFGVATTLRSEFRDISSLCLVSGAYEPYVSLQQLFSENGEVLMDGISWRKFSSGETIRLKPEFWKDLRAFDAPSALQDIRIPTLIVHGKADRKISYREAEAAYSALQVSPKKILLIPEGDHGIIDVQKAVREQFLHDIVDWFAKTL